MQVCAAGCDREDVPQLLLHTLQESLGASEKRFLAHTHGLHARALAALACTPCASGMKLGDLSLSPVAELSVNKCWQSIFMHAIDACDSRALASILPWFAEYCSCCASCDYTHAVPDALLAAKRRGNHSLDESLFLAMLQRAQEVRHGYVGSDERASRPGPEKGWVPSEETVQHTCLAVLESLAAWTTESLDVHCSATGPLWRQAAAAINCEMKFPELECSSDAQLGPQVEAPGKENQGRHAGNHDPVKDFSGIKARDAALREMLCTLRAVQHAEQACNSHRAKGLLGLCSQLQVLLGGE